MTEASGRVPNPAAAASTIAPRIGRLFRQRTEAINLFEEQSEEAARADAAYDAARSSIKMQRRMLHGAKSDVEANTWADVDPEVVELNFERKIMAEKARATKLRIENLADEIKVLHTLLVKEREDDQFHARYGA